MFISSAVFGLKTFEKHCPGEWKHHTQALKPHSKRVYVKSCWLYREKFWDLPISDRTSWSRRDYVYSFWCPYLHFLLFVFISAALIPIWIWPADGDRRMLAVMSLETLLRMPTQPVANSLGLVGVMCPALCRSPSACWLNAAHLDISCVSVCAPQPQQNKSVGNIVYILVEESHRCWCWRRTNNAT